MLNLKDYLETINNALAHVFPDYFSIKEPTNEVKNNNGSPHFFTGKANFAKIILQSSVKDDYLPQSHNDDFENDMEFIEDTEDDFEVIEPKSPAQTTRENRLVDVSEKLSKVLKLVCNEECLDSVKINQIEEAANKILEVLNMENTLTAPYKAKCHMALTINHINLLQKHIVKIKSEKDPIKNQQYFK